MSTLKSSNYNKQIKGSKFLIAYMNVDNCVIFKAIVHTLCTWPLFENHHVDSKLYCTSIKDCSFKVREASLLYISSWENENSCIYDWITCWMCVTTQPLKLCVTCVWPVVHLCSVGASHTSHLWYYLTVTTNNGGETTLPTLLPCRPRVHIRNRWPLSSSKSSNLSWWECLLFTCKLDLDERITWAEKPFSVVCSFLPQFFGLICVSMSCAIFQFDVLYSTRWLSSSAYGTSSGSCPTFPAAPLTTWSSWLPASFRGSASHSPYLK